MENLQLVNKTIAKNLAYYRKNAGMTQAEVAEKINYSDKSISKWESGNGVPDIYVLIQLSSLFDVTVNDIIGISTSQTAEKNRKNRDRLRLLIMLLSSGIVWLVATLGFVICEIVAPQRQWWLFFMFAVPVNAILLIVFSGVWKYKLLNFFSISVLVWTLIVSVDLTMAIVYPDLELWLLYLLGVPLQILATLWHFFRYQLIRLKNSSMAFLKVKGRKNKRGKERKEPTEPTQLNLTNKK
ncbi:MAG: helix-turn-helix transcriptional regulator [Clostridia bacterium]|nr:helix-turn-helix transcriptional regulator [Clostridia bacterium]